MNRKRIGIVAHSAEGASLCFLTACPDNTAHIVLERIAGTLPIPGLHIADVVTRELTKMGTRTAGLLGTKWTMNGPVSG